MARLGEIAGKVRAKNAGPFWLTLDVFCESAEVFDTVCRALSTERVAALYKVDAAAVKRFEIADLAVLKFSMPRPVVQGSLEDRDMHASSYGWILAELEIN